MKQTPLFNPDHVEIHYGVVQSSTVTDHNGTRPVFERVGQHRFYVDVVETDGFRIGMWDGSSYDRAILEAEALAKDFGPVHDLVLGDDGK